MGRLVTNKGAKTVNRLMVAWTDANNLGATARSPQRSRLAWFLLMPKVSIAAVILGRQPHDAIASVELSADPRACCSAACLIPLIPRRRRRCLLEGPGAPRHLNWECRQRWR